LLWIGQELQLDRQSHYLGVYHSYSRCQIQLKAFRLKAGGIHHEVLT
jgi:hypothetical protein